MTNVSAQPDDGRPEPVAGLARLRQARTHAWLAESREALRAAVERVERRDRTPEEPEPSGR